MIADSPARDMKRRSHETVSHHHRARFRKGDTGFQPDQIRIVAASAVTLWLENALIDRVGWPRVVWGRVMFRRLTIIMGVIAMGLVLNGCTKCGPIWDDWMQSPKSCKSDHF
jgi:hypothetical protein